ncbi:hypothetical protein Glove_739g7 [Diversispora epigaea]|uniref:Uncharacterized protein n=1 Tax=Diversispora epigaea TaxID=1348612 RepID=A0A397G059_9GLOM|nr:hypothetical protein Glove_739g7 [Diversispora epigaea]
MVIIETRRESRKRKDRERKASRRTIQQFRESDNKKSKQCMIKLRQNKNYNQTCNLISRNKKQKKNEIRLMKNFLAESRNIPLRILEMDEEFNNIVNNYITWPQKINQEISKNALAQYIDQTNLNELRELPCAVCSELHNNKNYKKISVNKINLFLFKVPPELTDPSFEINFYYGHPDIDNCGYNILLDRAGLIYSSEFQSTNNNFISQTPLDIRICNTCYTYLQKNKIPPLSLVNNMWIGPTPPCLQDLTIPEQLIISPGYLCMNLIQLTNKKHTYHKLRGHIVTLPQNPVSLVNILPLPIYRLCEYLKFVFVGKGKPPMNLFKKILQNKIKFDQNSLDLLPEGEIPESLTWTTTTLNIDSRDIEHFTGYTQNSVNNCNNIEDNSSDSDEDDEFSKFTNNNTISGAYELRPSGIVYTNDIPISRKELTLLSFQKLMNNTVHENHNDKFLQPQLILIPHDNKPLNEYSDEFLFPASFPILFPYGIGGHEGRPLHVSLRQYTNHLMRHRDPKFRQHRSFPFVAFNILQRREVSSETYNLTKNYNFERSANLIATLRSEDISIAINQEQNKQPITNPAILELLKNVNSSGSKLIASPQSRIRMHNEIRAVIIRDGIPALFITINPADLHSPIVMMYAGREIDIKNLLPENFPKTTERARLAYLDPSAVAKYFDITMQCIINTIIGYNQKNGGIFGIIKNYYGVVEYQDRGTPHCHMLIWLHGVPDPITLRKKLKNENDFCQRLLQYISEIVREDLSYLITRNEILTDEMLEAEYIRPKTVLEKRMHPSFQPIPDPRLPNFDENFRTNLLSIAKRTLFHRCNKTCKKYNRGLLKNCRFDFPRELVNPPGMIFPEQGIIAVQRTNAFINNHNPYITAACRGNSDIKFILTRKLALAYIHYITDYITKLDISTHSSFLMCAATLETFLAQKPNNNSLDVISKSRKLVTKCLNKIIGQTELTSPQVSAYLLGINDHYTPNKFISIYLKTFTSYLTKEWIKYQNSTECNCESDDELDTNDEQNNQDMTTETFVISTFNGKLMATNLRMNYQFRGNSLRGINLYDYAATI